EELYYCISIHDDYLRGLQKLGGRSIHDDDLR
nr:hypothetical protein [Tanacetum cinerariifolium]